ncbi:MAG: MmgE/PrpD family protein [Alphaproteobacteria bacterium]|nr:MmgE/PrpD family protein [Alphaproteobacteria bacterium]
MTAFQALTGPTAVYNTVADFILRTGYESLPEPVTDFAKLLILDLIGVAAGARDLDASRIARDHAVRFWAAGEGETPAPLLFDGRPASVPGTAYAAATQIDNLDAHDGWQPSKGHAGAALFPALYALAERQGGVTGREAIAAMVIGYEVGYRAAHALHATVPDYHTSGAWNSLGCAAIAARLLDLDRTQLRHALGIAEYHGPRSQMMREIANPTMLHDGTGMGAPVGLMAGLLAEDGFTGAPAATLEFEDATFAWADLGSDWLTVQQYIKPYPVCRWAHAPIDAALALRHEHGLTVDQIERVHIETFAYATEMSMGVPETSPKAQYSLAWPVASALAWGEVGVAAIDPVRFADPVLTALIRRISVTESDALSDAYPARRLAEVAIVLKDGSRFESGVVEASGGPEPLPDRAWVVEKFRRFARPALGDTRTRRIEDAVLGLDRAGMPFSVLLSELHPPS